MTKKLKTLTKSQRAAFKLYRSRGFSIAEARKAARMTYSQLARAVSNRLRQLTPVT